MMSFEKTQAYFGIFGMAHSAVKFAPKELEKYARTKSWGMGGKAGRQSFFLDKLKEF